MTAELVDIKPIRQDDGRTIQLPAHCRIKFKSPNTAEKSPSYIFRYISLQTFIFMFYYRQLIFNSAILYKDRNECTYPYDRASEELMPQLDKATKKAFVDYYCNLSEERGRYFLSCWFGSNDICPKETMRDSFSKDGVIVVFNREYLLKSLKSDFTFLPHSKWTEVTDLKLNYYGPVEYYSTIDFVRDVNDNNPITHPAFAKQNQFALESEYRFAIDVKEDIMNFEKYGEDVFDSQKLRPANNILRIFARLSREKSFNDIGLIKVIGCSFAARSVLHALSCQRQVRFEKLRGVEEYYEFTQEGKDIINVVSWEEAVNADMQLNK